MASLRAFECLVAVADTGSITQAARLLHLSQPAVSHQLASLERETRAQLLRRNPRGVTLTSAGRATVADARRAIEAAGSAVRAAREAGQATGGTLRITCAQSLMVALLAPVIGEWRGGSPDVAITVRESSSMEELLSSIEADEADLALVPGPVPERFTSVAIADEEVVVTAPAGHRLASRASLRLADLDGEPIVHFTTANGLGTWLDLAFAKAGVRPDPVMRTAITAAAPHLAASGLGIAVTPVSAVSPGFPGAVRPFSPRWVRRLMAVTPSEVDPLAARFVADLRRHGVGVPADVLAQLKKGGRR